MLRQEYAMTGTGPAVLSQTAIDTMTEAEELDTRFGRITLSRRNPITFPNGLLGIPDKFQFCLTNFPSDRLSRFKLLQSLEDNSLSFIMLPIALDNQFIERQDIELACRDLDIPLEEAVMLLVVTVYRDGSLVSLSVNTRAPVIMHAGKRLAAQYVFHTTKYEIRHPISL